MFSGLNGGQLGGPLQDQLTQQSARLRDEQYDWIPPRTLGSNKRGMQCGQCGMKFEYGKSYGYSCGSNLYPISHR
jgi:hypothetical protein